MVTDLYKLRGSSNIITFTMLTIIKFYNIINFHSLSISVWMECGHCMLSLHKATGQKTLVYSTFHIPTLWIVMKVGIYTYHRQAYRYMYMCERGWIKKIKYSQNNRIFTLDFFLFHTCYTCTILYLCSQLTHIWHKCY